MIGLNGQRRIGFLAAVSFGALAAGQAHAQGAGASAAPASQGAGRVASEGANEEIIVIANKRRENIQNVPIAITAVSGQRLKDIGITSTQDLARVVPGLNISTSISGTTARLRGVGTSAVGGVGAENSIATYVDGVYMLSLAGSLIQLNNIEQIEVLKGPQGTLFGRNATGGVISIRTRDPQHEPSGDFTLRYGNYDTISGQAYLTAGIGENLAADIAGYVSIQGKGWGKNIFTGKDVNTKDEYAVRSKWLFEPGDRDQFRVIGDYSETRGNRYNSTRLLTGTSSNYGPGSTLAGQRPDLAPYVASGALAPFAEVGDPYVYNGGFYDLDVFTQPRFKMKSGGGSLQWDHDFDGLKLMSLTAYRRTDADLANQFASVPAFRSLGVIRQRDTQFSQEVQLGSPDGANIAWVTGLYYLNGKGFDPLVGIGGTTLSPIESINIVATVTTKSGAAFGQVTAPLWQGGHVTAGLRYTIERRAIEGQTTLKFLPAFGGAVVPTPPVEGSKVFRKLTWRISVDQRFGPDVLGYISYNRGFKSGLFNGIPPNPLPVKPEVLDAFEFGLKTDFLDDRLRLNFSGFYYDYKNIQVTVTGAVSAFLDNGARARTYGAEVDLTARISSHLRIFGGATLMDSEFRSYDQAAFHVPNPLSAGGGVIGSVRSAKGNKLPYTSDLTFNVGAAYSAPVGDGKIDVDLNYSYSSKMYPTADNNLTIPSLGLLDGGVTYTLPGGALSAGVWARNITREKYYVTMNSQANPGGGRSGLVGAPRTYGVKVGYKF